MSQRAEGCIRRGRVPYRDPEGCTYRGRVSQRAEGCTQRGISVAEALKTVFAEGGVAEG